MMQLKSACLSSNNHIAQLQKMLQHQNQKNPVLTGYPVLSFHHPQSCLTWTANCRILSRCNKGHLDNHSLHSSLQFVPNEVSRRLHVIVIPVFVVALSSLVDTEAPSTASGEQKLRDHSLSRCRGIAVPLQSEYLHVPQQDPLQLVLALCGASSSAEEQEECSNSPFNHHDSSKACPPNSVLFLTHSEIQRLLG